MCQNLKQNIFIKFGLFSAKKIFVDIYTFENCVNLIKILQTGHKFVKILTLRKDYETMETLGQMTDIWQSLTGFTALSENLRLTHFEVWRIMLFIKHWGAHLVTSCYLKLRYSFSLNCVKRMFDIMIFCNQVTWSGGTVTGIGGNYHWSKTINYPLSGLDVCLVSIWKQQRCACSLV